MAKLAQNLKVVVVLLLVGGTGTAVLLMIADLPFWGLVFSQVVLALVIALVGFRVISDTRNLRRKLPQRHRDGSSKEPSSPAPRGEAGTAGFADIHASIERLEHAVSAQDVELRLLSGQLSRAVAGIEARTPTELGPQDAGRDLIARLDSLERSIEMVHSLVDNASGYRGRDILSRVVQQLEAIAGLYAVTEPRLILPPSRGWAASPDFLAVILNETLSRQKAPIVLECGAGLSTLVAAYALERRGDRGYLMSLEHDPHHAHRVNGDVRLHQLSHVELVTAPLTSLRLPAVENGDTGPWTWYDESCFTPPSTIDILVVDGPPGHSASDARYPAVPLLRPYLAPDAVILLDDAHRETEQRIAYRWAEEMQPCALEWLKTEKGAAVLKLDHDR